MWTRVYPALTKILGIVISQAGKSAQVTLYGGALATAVILIMAICSLVIVIIGALSISGGLFENFPEELPPALECAMFGDFSLSMDQGWFPNALSGQNTISRHGLGSSNPCFPTTGLARLP